MFPSYQEIIQDTGTEISKLRSAIPDTLKGFTAMAQAAGKSGALDAKTKELIAMALSVSARCDPCLGYHAKALVHLGCTREEFAEMLGMAIYMGGGPSLMYAARASAAYDEFAAATSKASA